ncbi:MAG: hypothetical protein FD180_1342 [Planctomycetota bacterium]|nr:MAG: hypothetical protein FD180_1342 [Planctomycetota bacterium]
MNRFTLVAFGLTTVSLMARAEEAPSTGEPVTVFVTDKDGKQVDVEGMTATVTVTIKGAGSRTATLEARKATDPTAKLPAAEHGGQIVTTVEGLRVEFIPGWSPGKSADAPCFEGTLALKAWACPMACVLPSDKPGKCSKCDMDLEISFVDFTASVKFKTAAGEQEAKGFSVPTPLPPTYAEAAQEARTQAGHAPKGSAALPRVRRVRRLSEGLVELAAADLKEAVRVKAKAIRTACDEAEKALLAGQDASEPLELMGKKVSSLPAEGGGK